MKKVLFIAATATLFAFSCQKEMESVQTASYDGFSFSANAPALNNPGTKASINDSHGLVWAAGDKIGVYVNDSSWGSLEAKHNPFTLVGEGGSTSAQFIWDYDDGDFKSTLATVAFFPWQGRDNYGTYNHFSDNYVHIKLAGSYGNNNDTDKTPYTSGKMLTPLVASITRTGDAYDPIIFKHTGGAVKVKVSDLPAGAHSIGMTTATQQIQGYYKIAVADAGTTNMSLDGDAEPTKKTIWLNFEPTNSSRPFTFLFPVPALNENEKLSFQIYDKNDVLVWSRSVSSHEAINHGDLLLLGGDEAISIEPYRQLKEVSSEWGVCGTFTSWDSDIEMMTDGESCVVKGIELEANAEFKIRTKGSWGNSYGSSALTNSASYAEDSSGNIKIKSTGEYDIVFNIPNKKIYVAPTDECPYPSKAHHYTSIKNATELGTTETANCYVITEAGSYSIPVVKGNDKTQSAGTVGGVELLWETYNNNTDVTPNSVIAAVDWDERDNSHIFFKTPDTLVPGNALIAAKDANGDIIWSWHIWIPATALTEVGSYDVNAKYLMDRNLGALRATVAGNSIIDVTSIGLFYQWGRKDPFVGPGYFDEGKYLEEGKIAGTARTSGKVQLSLAESIKQPTFFARGYYEGDTQRNPDWCSDQNGEYWGDSGNKSIYDPCPEGYRVPKRDNAKLLWASTVTGYEYNKDYYWFKVGNPAVVFPAAGWIDGGSIKSTCRFGIWNSHHDSWGPSIDTDPMYGYNSYAAYARRFYIESNAAKLKNSSVYKSLGYGVRCESISNSVPQPIPAGAANIELDGAFGDWAGAETISNTVGDAIQEWKYGWNDDYLCFYFKIKRSEIKAGSNDAFVEGKGYSFNWRRYIYIALDTDNNSSKGSQITSGGMSFEGGEVKAIVYPFRGYSSTDSGTDGAEVVNGVDSQGYIQCPVGTEVSGAKITAWGAIGASYGELEIGIPKDKIGSLSDKIRVQFSLSSNLTGQQVIELE